MSALVSIILAIIVFIIALKILGALLGLVLGMVYVIAQRRNLPQDWRNARHAWALTIFGITIAAMTVHLWNALFVLFMFLIGAGMWLYDTNPQNGKAEKTRTPTEKPNYGTLF